MTFLAPLGLLALLTLPIIVILHLMRERRRRVVVPSLLLWELLPPRREARRRRRLPLTLLLLLHLLVAALIALALARPQWATSLLAGEENLALVIDTSTSMAAPAGASSGSRMDAARSRAAAAINQLAGRESVGLISAGPHPALIDRGGVDASARLLAALDELEAGGTGSDIAGALTLAEAALRGLPGARIIVFSDAAIPTLGDLAGRTPALPVAWNIVGGPRDNRAIVTLAARPRGANGPVQLYARAVNYGDAPLNTLLRLYRDDELLDTRAVAFQPDGEVELTWTLPSGGGLLRAELIGADDLAADDQAMLNLDSARPLRALLVSPSPATMERALRAQPGLSLTVLDPLAYPGAPEAAQADLTIFERYLPAEWPAGAVLAIDPPDSALLGVSARLRTPESPQARPAPGASLLDGLSLGSVDFGPAADVVAPAWTQPLLTRGDQTLILRGRSGRSEVAIWAFDPARGNLTARLAFPLLVARTVRDLAPSPLPGASLAGERVALRADPRADRFVISGPDGTSRLLPIAADGTALLELDAPGLYQLEERAGSTTLFAAPLPANAGSPIESDLAPRQPPPASPPPAAAPTEIDPAEVGRQLWPWLAALALIVGSLEWLYVHGARRPGVSN